jgi:hypothetical protein
MRRKIAFTILILFIDEQSGRDAVGGIPAAIARRALKRNLISLQANR